MSIPPDGKASFGSATSCTPSLTVHRPFDTRQLGQLLVDAAVGARQRMVNASGAAPAD